MSIPSLVRIIEIFAITALTSELTIIIEEITGIDIVAAQIQIAAGATLPQLGLSQDAITKRGFAIQCRITTEDAAAGFQPDTGKIEVYRSAGGNGVRLDASSGFAGAQITVNFFVDVLPCSFNMWYSRTTIVCLSSAPLAVRRTKSPGARCYELSSSFAYAASRYISPIIVNAFPMFKGLFRRISLSSSVF